LRFRRDEMTKSKFSVIMLILWFSLLIYSINLNLILKKTEKTNVDMGRSIDNLIKERGHNWIVVNTAPDSIYFVTWGGDTTWYIKTITYSPDVITIHDAVIKQEKKCKQINLQ